MDASLKKSSLKIRKDDLYETPDVAVHALLRAEALPKCIWECACGPGRIVHILRERGHDVYATDLVDYGCPDSISRVDFLMTLTKPSDLDCIVTNPPFKLAREFVAHAMDIGISRIVMLLRLAFVEGVGRSSILDNAHLARVHVFRKRLPMMHVDGSEVVRANSGMAFAWFVWDRDHSGPTELHRISWEKTPEQ